VNIWFQRQAPSIIDRSFLSSVKRKFRVSIKEAILYTRSHMKPPESAYRCREVWLRWQSNCHVTCKRCTCVQAPHLHCLCFTRSSREVHILFDLCTVMYLIIAEWRMCVTDSRARTSHFSCQWVHHDSSLQCHLQYDVTRALFGTIVATYTLIVSSAFGWKVEQSFIYSTYAFRQLIPCKHHLRSQSHGAENSPRSMF
jgi:hypothetical protein